MSACMSHARAALVCHFGVMCVAEVCRHQSVSCPPCCYLYSPPAPPAAGRRSDVIDWMITLPLTSIRSPPAVNQRLHLSTLADALR